MTMSFFFSELWALVNNAGIGLFCEAEWCPVSAYEKMFEVNSLGMVRVTKAFLPLLRQAQGRVVNVASLAGKSIQPLWCWWLIWPIYKIRKTLKNK